MQQATVPPPDGGPIIAQTAPTVAAGDGPVMSVGVSDGLANSLSTALGPDPDMVGKALILHINREVIHHGAEIALLRDLFQAQPR